MGIRRHKSFLSENNVKPAFDVGKNFSEFAYLEDFLFVNRCLITPTGRFLGTFVTDSEFTQSINLKRFISNQGIAPSLNLERSRKSKIKYNFRKSELIDSMYQVLELTHNVHANIETLAYTKFQRHKSRTPT